MDAGACLCGAVRYEIDLPLGEVRHCHCSMCRKHHGAPFATTVDVPVGGFRWTCGQATLIEYQSSPERLRAVCQVCGAVAPTRLGERMLVPVGNLIGSLAPLGDLHMFVDSRAPWHVIGDALPRYGGPAPGWDLEVERPVAPVLEGALRGSCLCGAVTFSVGGPPPRWMQCHCSRCRRGRSAAHGSNGFYPLIEFAWLSGHELVRKYKVPEAERFGIAFCSRCGGGAPLERDNVPFVQVPMGLLDAAVAAHPQAHIHVASKASWYTIDDDLPQFAELP